MTITILGTGTSCGVPVVGCQCDVCQSTHPKDKRLRCSILVETEQTRLLIDAGPDFRQQMLTQPFRRIDGILVTHSHYDHVGGMDDIRPYCQFGKMEVYADAIARQGMLEMLPYCFAENRYPGVPQIGLNEIRAGEADYTFVEIMACPGGCVNGGGQPQVPASVRNFTDIRAERAKALYNYDENMPRRKSHENESVKKLYAEYFGEPNSHRAHEVLHTKYVQRKIHEI